MCDPDFQLLGSGLYLDASLINHSCDPALPKRPGSPQTERQNTIPSRRGGAGLGLGARRAVPRRGLMAALGRGFRGRGRARAGGSRGRPLRAAAGAGEVGVQLAGTVREALGVELGANAETAELAAATAVGLFYLTAKPSVVAGFFETYLLGPVFAAREKATFTLTEEQLVSGPRLGQGAFGTVTRGVWVSGAASEFRSFDEAAEGPGKKADVVVKSVRTRNKEALRSVVVEAWMNRRLRRAAPSIGAPFLGELSVREGQQTEQRCLVWEWDGELTLQDFLEDRAFPGSLASHLQEQGYRTGRLLEDEAVVKRVIRDLLGALAQLHAIGIVHRDIKPANLLMSSTGSTKGRFKIIDFGAACDLRAGYNCECGWGGKAGRMGLTRG